MAKNSGWTHRFMQAATLVGLLSVSACGSNGAGMQPTITIDEANHRVEDYSMKAREALPPEAHYELAYSERAGDCSDPTDRGPKNRVLATRSYQILGLAKEQIPSYFDALRAWWLNHDFRVLDNNPPNEYLWVENKTDGFRMTLQANDQGGLFLDATSPCVWPNGTPEPEALGTETSDTGTHVAQDQPTPPAALPASAEAESARARKPRPRRAPVEDEDFDQIDWTGRNLR